LQSIDVVVEQSECGVAPATEKAAHHAGGMVVVDSKPLHVTCAEVDRDLWSVADATQAVLVPDQLLISSLVQSVPPQVNVPHPGSPQVRRLTPSPVLLAHPLDIVEAPLTLLFLLALDAHSSAAMARCAVPVESKKGLGP
jgi:hypothetical protein